MDSGASWDLFLSWAGNIWVHSGSVLHLIVRKLGFQRGKDWLRSCNWLGLIGWNEGLRLLIREDGNMTCGGQDLTEEAQQCHERPWTGGKHIAEPGSGVRNRESPTP